MFTDWNMAFLKMAYLYLVYTSCHALWFFLLTMIFEHLYTAKLHETAENNLL